RNFALFRTEVNLKSLLEECSHRMRPEALKLLEGQRWKRASVKLLNEVGMRRSLFLRGGEPFAGVTLVLIRNEVNRVKRHTTMTTGNMCLNSLFAFIAVSRFFARQIVALPDIVHQF